MFLGLRAVGCGLDQLAVSSVEVLETARSQSEGVGVPRAAYTIPGRGGLWGGWRRDVRCRRRRFRRFRFRRRRRRRSPRVGRAGGRATHPRPTLGPMGPMG